LSKNAGSGSVLNQSGSTTLVFSKVLKRRVEQKVGEKERRKRERRKRS
jgi:hypothetical protein